MSKCWYCNEELTTANYCDEHIGICTKCYGSMFKVSNEFVKGLTDKIADLEAKLAESEKGNRDLEDDHNKLIEQYNKQYNELCKEIEVHSSARERFVKKIKELDEQHNQDKIELLEKVKTWCKGNSITVFYNELETEIKEKHIVVDRPQENGALSLEKYIDNQIKQLKEKK